MFTKFSRKTIEVLRREIAEAVAGEYADDEPVTGALDVAEMAIKLAEAEGYVQAREHLTRVFERHGAEGYRDAARDLLLRGADDQWSGRTNDARRARFDGIRAAVNDTRYRYDPEGR